MIWVVIGVDIFSRMYSTTTRVEEQRIGLMVD
jgi:hypothetical protein